MVANKKGKDVDLKRSERAQHFGCIVSNTKFRLLYPDSQIIYFKITQSRLYTTKTGLNNSDAQTTCFFCTTNLPDD